MFSQYSSLQVVAIQQLLQKKLTHFEMRNAKATQKLALFIHHTHCSLYLYTIYFKNLNNEY